MRWTVFVICLCGSTVVLKVFGPLPALVVAVAVVPIWFWWSAAFFGFRTLADQFNCSLILAVFLANLTVVNVSIVFLFMPP